MTALGNLMESGRQNGSGEARHRSRMVKKRKRPIFSSNADSLVRECLAMYNVIRYISGKGP